MLNLLPETNARSPWKMRTIKGGEREEVSGSGVAYFAGKRRNTAAGRMNSSELFLRPGGVFSRGKRGERRGRGWGIYRQNGRNQFALNSPEFGKDLPAGFSAVICSGGRRR